MKKLLTPKDVAEVFNCALSTVYTFHQTGRLKSIKIGKLVRFDPEEIERLIETSKNDTRLNRKAL